MNYDNNDIIDVEPTPRLLNKLPDPIVNIRTSLIFSLLGSLGLSILDLALSNILTMLNVNPTLFDSALHFLVYTLMLLSMCLILWHGKVLKPLFSSFTKLRPYVYGVGYGLIVIFASVVYSQLVALTFGVNDSNQNQNNVVALITAYPLLSLIWIPFAGPLVEELTYRVGLFNFVKHFNRKLAYVAVGIVFGLIHFNIPLDAGGAIDMPNFIIELANLPNYIISGLLFSYIYDKENFATVSVAHITNNLVSYIGIIVSIYA